MYGAILFLHILAATVWTGGHLVLAIAILPRVLRERSPAKLLEFESAYERVGIPALVVQVATGLWLAHRMVPELGRCTRTSTRDSISDWICSLSVLAKLVSPISAPTSAAGSLSTIR